MTTSRTARRIITLTASVALLATAPAGVALAQDSGTGSDCSQTSRPTDNISRGHGSMSGSHGDDIKLSSLTATQVAAVNAARDAYFASAKAAKTALKSSIDAIRTAMKAELAPLGDAARVARDAYKAALGTSTDPLVLADLKAKAEAAFAAYRTAYDATRAKYQAQQDAAIATAKTYLAAAEKTYTDAVIAAFAPATAPAGLLKAPGHSLGKGGHNGWLNGNHHGSSHAAHGMTSISLDGSHFSKHPKK